MLVFFDQEEEGLVGSRAFVKFLRKNEYEIHSVHTFDQMGWDNDQDRAIELELPTSELEALYKLKAKEFGIQVHVTKVNSTDHHSFREQGFNAVGITEEYVNDDTTPFKDTAMDTYDTVSLAYIESTTQLVYEVIKDIISE